MGEFEKEDIMRISNHKGDAIGLGKTNCSSTQVNEVIGKHGKKAVVHYDYLYIEQL